MNALEFLRPKSRAAIAAEDLIALVSDSGSEDTIRSLILDQTIVNAHVQRGTIDDAIELLQGLERSPRHLIVDVSGSAMPLSDLARLADVCDPSAKVIVVGDRNDVGLFRSLLGIGVQDYLVKPLTVELVQRALAASDPGAAVRSGKAISFVGSRGGVGVTTIAVSLARHLADETRRRIAYVDLNFHGGAANSMLGLASNNGLTELLQNMQRTDPQLINQALVSRSDRLFMLSSELAYGNDFTLRPGAIAELIDALKHHFHYVLIDLPGRSGRLVEESLDASKLIYVVADRSVHAAREATRLWRFAEDRGGEPTISLLLNNPLEPVAGRVEAADFKRALGRGSVHEFPYEPKALAVAENLGEPIASKKPMPFAAAIVELANGVTGRETAIAKPWYARLISKRRIS